MAETKTPEAAVAAAETALSDANENGSPTAIQKAETRLSNAMERFNALAPPASREPNALGDEGTP